MEGAGWKSTLRVRGKVAIPVVWFVGIVYLLLVVTTLPWAPRRVDFSVYYETALALRKGLNPYDVGLNHLSRELKFYPTRYEQPGDAPTFVLCFEPLTVFSPGTAYLIWSLLSVASLVGFFLLLVRACPEIDRSSAYILALSVLAFTPIAQNFRWSQSNTFVLLGLMVFLRLVERRYDRTAGVLLALLGLLRVFPLVMGGYLLVRRRWHAVGSLAVAFFIGAAMTYAFVGFAVVKGFFDVSFPLLSGGHWVLKNLDWRLIPLDVALDTFASRFVYFLAGVAPSASVVLARRVVVPVVKLGILALTFRATISGDDRDARAFSLWIVTMLILSPVVWLHYLVLLLIPLGQIALARVRGKTSDRTWHFAQATYCLLVVMTTIMSSLTATTYGPVSPMAQLGFLGLLCAYVAAYLFASEQLDEQGAVQLGLGQQQLMKVRS